MLVSPSLQNQVIHLAKSEDKKLFCICVLAHQPKTLSSLLEVDENLTRISLDNILPFNLLPIGILDLGLDQKEKAIELCKKLSLENTYNFDFKSEVWKTKEDEIPLKVAKEDCFLDTIFIGTSTQEPIDKLSSKHLTRKPTNQRRSG